MGDILTNIKDDSCLDFVLDKMRGNMLLVDGATDEDEIESYKSSKHVNYFIPSDDGFLCLVELDQFVYIPFAWHIGKHETLKEMVKLGKQLYKHYSIDQGKPIYYTGLKNFYGHNSREVMENVWIFEPKHI